MKKLNEKISKYILLLIFIMSCKGQSLDISTIDFDKPVNIYSLENLKVYRKKNQKGHFEVKKDKEGISLVLKIMEKK